MAAQVREVTGSGPAGACFYNLCLWIGKCIALDLARRNAHVILACRDKEKGQAALDEIRRATGNPSMRLRLLDVSSMASVRDFARQFLKEESRLDILVNNAGITGLPVAPTAEDLEQMFATNVLGPFLLTSLLLDTVKASAPARIVNVSSFVHCKGTVNIRFLTGEEWPKSCTQAYYSSKLMNVVFTIELASPIHCPFSRPPHSPSLHTLHSVHILLEAGPPELEVRPDQFRSAEEGATSTLYCAVSREVEGITGKYFDSDCSLVLPADRAQDPGIARKLWDALEQLTGLRDGGTK
ncbi:PREDICTED: retinol dehydrogenase 13 [Gekko japonicus]|uniref:Retinol dehydrogenase 13 n=1 Tax=Gekko japonicus TaxID=146911 RepID=A0ABM1KNH7_GEKJA|nr:PREDICTED: retinol dehydrogenase 13 [Gekko japonicus]